MDNEEMKKKAAESADKAKEAAGKAAGKAKEFYGKAKESEIVKKISAKTKLKPNAILGIAGGILLVLLVVIIANVGGGKSSSSAENSVAEEGKEKTPVNASSKKVKAPSKATPASDFQYDITKEGDGVVILDYIGTGNTVVRIPDEIEGYPVVEIADGVFHHKTGVEDPKHKDWYNNRWNNCEKPFDLVYVPRSVTRVAYGAFLTWIRSVDVNDDDYLQGALQVDMDVSKLKSFSYIMGPKAVYVAEKFGGLRLKDTDIVISKDFNASLNGGVSCFQKSNVTSVKFEDGVKIISVSMFSNCKNLKTVTIPASVTEIQDDAFDGCENLETVNFAPGAKIKYTYNIEYSIYDRSVAFKDCPKLSLKMRQAIKATGYDGEF